MMKVNFFLIKTNFLLLLLHNPRCLFLPISNGEICCNFEICQFFEIQTKTNFREVNFCLLIFQLRNKLCT